MTGFAFSALDKTLRPLLYLRGNRLTKEGWEKKRERETEGLGTSELKLPSENSIKGQVKPALNNK